MHVPGLQFFPTKSLYEASNSSNQRDTIYQQAFTYNSETDLPSKAYLVIPLNKLIEPDETDNPDKKFNSILVSGYVSFTSGISDEFILKFVHSFVTDWNIYSINNPISYDSDLQDYFFPSQNTNLANAWSPSGAAANWVNGASNVDEIWDIDNYPDYTPTGWSCDVGESPSGNTGPSGGVDVNGNPSFSPLTSQKYLYVECSGVFNIDHVMVTRTPGVNYSVAMLDNISNNLNLKFYVHGFSTTYAEMGDLEIYISPDFPTTKQNSTLLYTITPPGGGGDVEFNQTSNSSQYQEILISLNAYKEVNDVFYIYFVSNRTSGYRGDMAIDGIQIIEENDNNLNFEKSFSYQVSPEIANGAILEDSGITIDSQETDFTDSNILFLLSPPEGKEIYIKGSYLLM